MDANDYPTTIYTKIFMDLLKVDEAKAKEVERAMRAEHSTFDGLSKRQFDAAAKRAFAYVKGK